MKKILLICGVLLLTLAGCDHGPPTFTETLHLKKEVRSAEEAQEPKVLARSVVDYSVKFDKAPVEGYVSLGTAYYRMDITNRSDYQMVIREFHLEFVDELQITIDRCIVIGGGTQASGPITKRLGSGETFTRNGSCKFPISQMDLVETVSTSVKYHFWNRQTNTSGIEIASNR